MIFNSIKNSLYLLFLIFKIVIIYSVDGNIDKEQYEHFIINLGVEMEKVGYINILWTQTIIHLLINT